MYEVEFRSSKNPRQKETIDDVILAQENKNIIFSKANVGLLMVSKANFFYQRGIRNTNSNLILCQEVEKWH